MSDTERISFSRLQDCRDRAEERFFRSKLAMSCAVTLFGLLTVANLLAFAFIVQERLLVSGTIMSGLCALTAWTIGGQKVDELEARFLRYEAAIDAYLTS